MGRNERSKIVMSDEEIVEFVESIYRGDRYRLITTLSIPHERRRARGDGQDGRGARTARARG